MLESNETPKVGLNQLGFNSELGISHVREDGSLNETQVPLAKENGGGDCFDPLLFSPLVRRYSYPMVVGMARHTTLALGR